MKNRLKFIFKSIFGFSRAETNGFIVLILLLIITVMLSFALRSRPIGKEVPDEIATKRLDSLVLLIEEKLKDSQVMNVPKLQKEGLIGFTLNPNDASFTDFRKIGLSVELANRIIKFRKSGGKFFNPEDVKKIYGLNVKTFEHIQGYLKFPVKPKTKRYFEPEKLVIREIRESFDINTADTLQLKQIKGIGTKLSKRIIRFREKLGGYHNLHQLDEVYGLDSAVVMELKSFAFIKEAFKPDVINVNKAFKTELSNHPYISFKLADAIIQYRIQHGPFESMDQLLNIHILSEKDFIKIKPYVSF